jgi:hypothetical protein
MEALNELTNFFRVGLQLIILLLAISIIRWSTNRIFLYCGGLFWQQCTECLGFIMSWLDEWALACQKQLYSMTLVKRIEFFFPQNPVIKVNMYLLICLSSVYVYYVDHCRASWAIWNSPNPMQTTNQLLTAKVIFFQGMFIFCYAAKGVKLLLIN